MVHRTTVTRPWYKYLWFFVWFWKQEKIRKILISSFQPLKQFFGNTEFFIGLFWNICSIFGSWNNQRQKKRHTTVVPRLYVEVPVDSVVQKAYKNSLSGFYRISATLAWWSRWPRWGHPDFVIPASCVVIRKTAEKLIGNLWSPFYDISWKN